MWSRASLTAWCSFAWMASLSSSEAESPGDAHALGGRETEVVAVLPRPGAFVLTRVPDVPCRVLRVVAFAELDEVVGLDRALQAEFLGPETIPGSLRARGPGCSRRTR